MPKLNGSTRCLECNGKGALLIGERHGFATYDDCPGCNGRGRITRWQEARYIESWGQYAFWPIPVSTSQPRKVR